MYILVSLDMLLGLWYSSEQHSPAIDPGSLCNTTGTGSALGFPKLGAPFSLLLNHHADLFELTTTMDLATGTVT